jgi:hypothetical protein
MKPKYGTVREDGKIYYGLNHGKEYWMSKKMFEKKKSEYKKNKLLLESKTVKRKRGEIREDGMVFWAYHFTCKNGEQWITKEQYFSKTETARKSAMERYRSNPKRFRESANKYHRKNKAAYSASFKKWYYDNREYYLLRCKTKNKTEEHKKRAREYQKNRKAIDSMYRLRHVISSGICNAIKSRGFRKKSKTSEILGCSFGEFKSHLESQFKKGMSWENRSEWHIDHIMPVSMAKTYDEVIRLNHYRNLRPLWAHENLAKSDKTPDILVLF